MADALRKKKYEGRLMSMQVYSPELCRKITEMKIEFIRGSLKNLIVQPTLFGSMKDEQVKDPELIKKIEAVREGRETRFTLFEDGIL